MLPRALRQTGRNIEPHRRREPRPASAPAQGAHSSRTSTTREKAAIASRSAHPHIGSNLQGGPMASIAMTTFDLTAPTKEQLEPLIADLNDEERHVLLDHGTEAPFCGIFLDEKRPGVFTCRLCGLPLFHGGTKFESGTRWPNFPPPFRADPLPYISRTNYGMDRTANVCSPCGSSQAHVFKHTPAAHR